MNRMVDLSLEQSEVVQLKPTTRDQAAKVVKDDTARWAAVINDAGIKPAE